MRPAPRLGNGEEVIYVQAGNAGAHMIRHIVFDIGMVLLQYDPERPYREIIPDMATRRWFMREVCSPQWNMEQDRGRPWAEAEAVLIDAWPDYEAWIRAFRASWPQMVFARVPGTADILSELLAADWDVTMLTNFSADTFPVAQEMYPELTTSRGVTVSGAVKMIKPEPEIYRHHAQTFGLDPAATLFFDDSPKNVAGAEACGWQARHFVDAPTMRKDLAAAGVAF